MRRLIHDSESRLAGLAGKIESLSPLAVLARGYTITQNATSKKVIRHAEEVKVGQSIVTRFVSGAVVSKVERIEDENA